MIGTPRATASRIKASSSSIHGSGSLALMFPPREQTPAYGSADDGIGSPR